MNLVFSSTVDLTAAIAARISVSSKTLRSHPKQIDSHNVGNQRRHSARYRRRTRTRGKSRCSIGARTTPGPLHGVPFTLKDTHEDIGHENHGRLPTFR